MNAAHEATEAETTLLFQPGDMALILSVEGEVRTAAFDVDTSGLTGNLDDLSEADEKVMRQGQKLFALAVAAHSETLMDILIEITANPEVVEDDAIRRLLQPH